MSSHSSPAAKGAVFAARDLRNPAGSRCTAPAGVGVAGTRGRRKSANQGAACDRDRITTPRAMTTEEVHVIVEVRSPPSRTPIAIATSGLT